MMCKAAMTTTAAWMVLCLTLAVGCHENRSGSAPSAAHSAATNPESTPKDRESADAHAGHDHAGGSEHASHADHSEEKSSLHSGWWCDEHGIPEAVCSMCSSKVAASFQKKGDWCADHDRARSQCFVCEPTLQEKFAKQYRVRYGKEPPAIEVQ